jgi:hypothetical protein
VTQYGHHQIILIQRGEVRRKKWEEKDLPLFIEVKGNNHQNARLHHAQKEGKSNQATPPKQKNSQKRTCPSLTTSTMFLVPTCLHCQSEGVAFSEPLR